MLLVRRRRDGRLIIFCSWGVFNCIFENNLLFEGRPAFQQMGTICGRQINHMPANCLSPPGIHISNHQVNIMTLNKSRRRGEAVSCSRFDCHVQRDLVREGGSELGREGL